jgi:hypothetical protein
MDNGVPKSVIGVPGNTISGNGSTNWKNAVNLLNTPDLVYPVHVLDVHTEACLLLLCSIEFCTINPNATPLLGSGVSNDAASFVYRGLHSFMRVSSEYISQVILGKSWGHSGATYPNPPQPIYYNMSLPGTVTPLVRVYQGTFNHTYSIDTTSAQYTGFARTIFTGYSEILGADMEIYFIGDKYASGNGPYGGLAGKLYKSYQNSGEADGGEFSTNTLSFGIGCMCKYAGTTNLYFRFVVPLN